MGRETLSANKSAFSPAWIADQLVKNGITRQVNTGRWYEPLPMAERLRGSYGDCVGGVMPSKGTDALLTGTQWKLIVKRVCLLIIRTSDCTKPTRPPLQLRQVNKQTIYTKHRSFLWLHKCSSLHVSMQ